MKKICDHDTVLFHWAPTLKRKQIIRYGLRTHMRPTVSTPGWRPPYVCLAESPSWAWALSGMHRPDIGSWDLWQTWLYRLGEQWDAIPVMDNKLAYQFHEVRAYERIYKRDLWLVGTRETP